MGTHMNSEQPHGAPALSPAATIVIIGAGQAGGWAAQTLRSEGDLSPIGDSPGSPERARSQTSNDQITGVEVAARHPLGQDRDAHAGARGVHHRFGQGEMQKGELGRAATKRARQEPARLGGGAG